MPIIPKNVLVGFVKVSQVCLVVTGGTAAGFHRFRLEIVQKKIQLKTLASVKHLTVPVVVRVILKNNDSQQ